MLAFSHDPNTSVVERNFTLTGDGNNVKGNFYWEDKKLFFNPIFPLQKNIEYIINLSLEACDIKGLCLERAFEKKFTTKYPSQHPVLLSCFPSSYSEVNNIRTEIVLNFSRPIPYESLYDNVSFSPSMSGFWNLNESKTEAIFTPADNWTLNKRYEIRILSSLTDANGYSLGKDFISVFTVSLDSEMPLLLYALSISNNGIKTQLVQDITGYANIAGLSPETEGWEKNDKLCLVFSKEVDPLTVKNSLSAENAPNIILESLPGFKTEIIFAFESRPAFESRFTFKLKSGVRDRTGNESAEEYIYRIFANGLSSRPPVLAGLRIPLSPGNTDDMSPVFYSSDSLFDIIPITEDTDNYPIEKKIKTWVELYFETAQAASIDTFSIMELFRVETSNNVLRFYPSHIKTSDFTINYPQSGTEKLKRVEIIGDLINTANFGLIHFQIAAGLKDSLGNKNDNVQRISLIK
ncbi:MAG: Ig-like domain-containing protein [Treponema sp.]|nr:Ig-like domain-containing protein [Treponema sp.]